MFNGILVSFSASVQSNIVVCVTLRVEEGKLTAINVPLL